MRPPGRGDGADPVTLASLRCGPGLALRWSPAFSGSLSRTETPRDPVPWLACSAEETARLLEVEEELKMMRVENFYWHCHGLNVFF